MYNFADVNKNNVEIWQHWYYRFPTRALFRR